MQIQNDERSNKGNFLQHFDHQLIVWCLLVFKSWISKILCFARFMFTTYKFDIFLAGVLRCDVFSNRPSVLDNFALLSGQLNTINKLLKNEKTPSFRHQVIIPLLLSPDRDEDLAVSTSASLLLPLLSEATFHPPPPFPVRNSPSSESQCSAMRLSPTTCGPNLTRRWRSRRSSWAPRRHGSAPRWRRWGDGEVAVLFSPEHSLCLTTLFAFPTTETDPDVEQTVFKSAGEAQQPSWWQGCRKCRWIPLLDSLSQHNFNI